MAWSSALDGQIADYDAAPDEYLRARSADLADLRDRVTRALGGSDGAVVKIPDGAIVCADDLPPSRFLEIDWSHGGGLALLGGSPTSHVAMLARARGIPMVVQLGTLADSARTALLDGEGATLELDPTADQVGLFERRRETHKASSASARAILRRPAASWGGETIRLLINIQRVEDLEHADAQYADGIGLMRTEFLLGGRRTAGRGDAISGLRRRASLGRQTTGDDPHLRCRRRQAGARLYLRRRSKSLPRCSRLASLPGTAADIFRSASRARPRRGARKSQGHVSDGDDTRGTGSGPQAACRCRRAIAS